MSKFAALVGTMRGVGAAWVVAGVISLLAAGCSVGPTAGERGSVGGVAHRPAPITHVVLVALNDSKDADELRHECDGLAGIPGVEFFSAGSPLRMGRANVDVNFDVGMVMGFATKEAYLAYVDHPVHQRLLKGWVPRTREIRVFDVVDETP